MTKWDVRIAYRSEKVEREVKMSKVGPLLSVSRMQVKAHARRQDPAYANLSSRMESLKNRPVYA